MCKFVNNTKHSRIDKCMKEYVIMINRVLLNIYETKACCCGHGKYPKTLIVGLKRGGHNCFELFTGKVIPRTRNFYVRDKQGYYFIPELKNENKI